MHLILFGLCSVNQQEEFDSSNFLHLFLGIAESNENSWNSDEGNRSEIATLPDNIYDSMRKTSATIASGAVDILNEVVVEKNANETENSKWTNQHYTASYWRQPNKKPKKCGLRICWISVMCYSH